ncbi:hypothetical protein ID47_05420 [Candidatus Paracaedibacter acanthamoebae]|uniref:Polysaccharide chain length determinant N-terminal domain-containing protein n=2 Tax=Candidatus Odyssella acanthamoebae TaxID=91604 RepID=A0A077B017_9PROT|nr:hypothetical protein ID47_05420 [Candidatus Paracaedibacter acanthamoebae]
MAQAIAQEAGQYFVQASMEQVERIVSKLQATTATIEHNLTKCNEKISFFSRATLIVILVSTLVGGLLGGGLVHYLFPPLDNKTATQIKYGEYLLSNWSKLDKKDRDKLASLMVSGSHQ